MPELAERKCQPCEGDTPPLNESQISELSEQVPGWGLEDGKVARDIKLKNFAAALNLVNRIGDLAEAEGHHPDICIHSWNRVKLELYTHAIGGLSENDFILAAKINRLTADESP